MKDQGLLWHRDQPFSSRPIHLASYVAATMLRDYKESIRILELGRNTPSGGFTYLNNLAFAYASNDQPVKAAEILDGVRRSQLTKENLVYLNVRKD